MEIDGYRAYRQDYIDRGEEVGAIDIISGELAPDFKGHNTIQHWNIVPKFKENRDLSDAYVFNILRPVAASLIPRSIHEITIKNVSAMPIELRFNRLYKLIDEDVEFDPATALNPDYESVILGPRGTAYYYATAISEKAITSLHMRTGTEDNKNI